MTKIPVVLGLMLLSFTFSAAQTLPPCPATTGCPDGCATDEGCFDFDCQDPNQGNASCLVDLNTVACLAGQNQVIACPAGKHMYLGFACCGDNDYPHSECKKGPVGPCEPGSDPCPPIFQSVEQCEAITFCNTCACNIQPQSKHRFIICR